MSPETDEEGAGAFSRIAVRWYDESTMVLANTVIRQTWQKHKQTFLLTSESVESGHPGLLMVPQGNGTTTTAAGPGAPRSSDGDPQWSSIY